MPAGSLPVLDYSKIKTLRKINRSINQSVFSVDRVTEKLFKFIVDLSLKSRDLPVKPINSSVFMRNRPTADSTRIFIGSATQP